MVPSVFSSTFDQDPAAQKEQSLCDLALMNSRSKFYVSVINLQYSVETMSFSIRVKNSVDPDQMPYQKPSDLVLQCLQRITNLA